MSSLWAISFWQAIWSQLEVYLWMYFKTFLHMMEGSICLTWWGKSKELSLDLKKKKKNSPNQFYPWKQFPNAWRCCIHLYKQQYTSIKTMGPRSHHTTQVILTPRDEHSLVRKVRNQSNWRTTAKDLVKGVEEIRLFSLKLALPFPMKFPSNASASFTWSNKQWNIIATYL